MLISPYSYLILSVFLYSSLLLCYLLCILFYSCFSSSLCFSILVLILLSLHYSLFLVAKGNVFVCHVQGEDFVIFSQLYFMRDGFSAVVITRKYIWLFLSFYFVKIILAFLCPCTAPTVFCHSLVNSLEADILFWSPGHNPWCVTRSRTRFCRGPGTGDSKNILSRAVVRPVDHFLSVIKSVIMSAVLCVQDNLLRELTRR